MLQHFQHAVVLGKESNRFKQKYEALLKRGVGETAARRTVCRALLSTVRAVWIKEEEYRDNPLN